MAFVNDDIANKLNELFKSELFKENNFIKIYKLLNIENTSPVASPVASPVVVAAGTATPPPPPPPLPKPAPVPKPASPTLPPKGIQKSANIYNTSILHDQNSNIVIVVFVIIIFEIDGTKTFIINEKYEELKTNIEDKFKDLNKEDLYDPNKYDEYVKYLNTNAQKKYIICIEPDFRNNNDDTTILVDDLFDILTNIYNSIIIIFDSNNKLQTLRLRLSVPSIMNADVSIINKKTILGCFSKIYKMKYSKYELYIENEELFNYYTVLLKRI